MFQLLDITVHNFETLTPKHTKILSMKRERYAKIVATLGPASSRIECIENLVHAGVDVFRLNFSHGTHHDHQENLTTIRRVEEKVDRPIAIIADLQGPKLRIGIFADGNVSLEAGQTFCLDMDPSPGDAGRVTLPHPEVFSVIKEGTDLLMNDGKIRVRVVSKTDSSAQTQVITGGTLSNHKGVNVPGEILPISALTDKDRSDLEFALSLGIDWVALSFVQRAQDVKDVRSLIKGRAGIISKLEKPQAIESLEDVVHLSDAIMVARGDLGVECPPEDVPVLQKRILSACHKRGTPVIVATQMLESMIQAPTPTRAEASDVATAIYDGADAVMLSAETAAGQYPVEAVSIMDKIIKRVEKDETYRLMVTARNHAPEHTTSDAICAAASQVATTVHAQAIVTFTTSGSTALRQSRQRPLVPVLGLTPDIQVARRLVLTWGIHAISAAGVEEFGTMIEKATDLARQHGFVQVGERIVVVAGVPFGTPGSTNILRIADVGAKI